MTDHAVFLTERRRLSSPPTNKVVTDEGEEDGRLLRFFDHGESIHDDLLAGFLKLCDKQFTRGGAKQEIIVRLPDGHPALEFVGKTILLSAVYMEPSRALDWRAIPGRLTVFPEEASTDTQKTRLNADLLEFQEDLRADQRWLQSLLKPIFEIKAS